MGVINGELAALAWFLLASFASASGRGCAKKEIILRRATTDEVCKSVADPWYEKYTKEDDVDDCSDLARRSFNR